MVATKQHHELYNQLRSIVGAKYVSDDLPALLSYTRDMSTFPAAKPQGVIVRAGSAAEVVEIVRLANQTRTPLIPMGGKASISGTPPGQPGRGIIVDMKRMDKVLDIDEVNMTVTVQCGITLGEMSAKVNERGFDFHAADMPYYPDTVGGQLSGMPGGGFGTYCFSIGLNTPYLLGMKVVLPDGSVVDTGTGEGGISTHRGHTWARGLHGPDLTGMFVGDGGIFGIKCEATYRMFRLPKFHKYGARCWDNVDDAFHAYEEIWEIDPYLYMQAYARGMILTPEFVSVSVPSAKPAWVLFWESIGNSQEEVDLKHRTSEAILARHGGRDAEPALLAFTSNFHLWTHELGRIATLGQYASFEFFVSRKDMLEGFKWLKEYVDKGLRDRGIDRSRVDITGGLASCGLGFGNVCYDPFFEQNDKELHAVLHEMFLEFLEQASRRGYVIDCPQGHESRVRAKQWTPEYYNYMLRLKKFLDPNNILNPGVTFP